MGKILRALTGPSGNTSPELRTYYSKMLLNKLVPVLQHTATHGSTKVHLDSVLPDEIEQATNKWREHFGLTVKPVWNNNASQTV